MNKELETKMKNINRQCGLLDSIAERARAELKIAEIEYTRIRNKYGFL